MQTHPNIGIDSMAFSTSKYFLDLQTLASHRNVEYAKYCEGIGQKQMSVFPPNEDIVTIGVDAAQKALSKIHDKNSIDFLIFATESSFDLSKSAGIYLHHFLQLKPDCRVIDIKQACYSATAALQLAKSFISENPESKVLIVGSDIVKYSPCSSGEPTQGGAAVAMVIAHNPRIMSIERHFGVHTNDIMDFWRPVNAGEALFDGKLSAYNYLKSLEITFARYLQKSGLSAAEIDYACFHAPFGKMAIKAAKQISKENKVKNTLIYNELIGNSCSSALYICLMSLLDHSENELSGKRVGMYSYGSGSVAEYFSGIVSDEYKTMLSPNENRKMLDDRIEISFKEYEHFCKVGNINLSDNTYKNIGNVRLATIKNGSRIYEQC